MFVDNGVHHFLLTLILSLSLEDMLFERLSLCFCFLITFLATAFSLLN